MPAARGLSKTLAKSLVYIRSAISEEEQRLLVAHIEPILKKRRYEKGHFDGVISAYKEVELIPSQSPPDVRAVLRRLAEQVCLNYDHNPTLQSILPPHIVDLAADGNISAHVDSVKHGGPILAGLSLLSTRVMRLEREQNTDKNNEAMFATAETAIEQVLHERSLYMLKDVLRYEYTHSILGPQDVMIHNHADTFAFQRRISIIFRDKP